MRWFQSALRSAPAAVAAAAAAAVSLASPPTNGCGNGFEKWTPQTSSAEASLRRRCLSSLAIRRDEAGAPGLSVCVSLRGRRLLSGGVGFADVENLTPCTERSLLRVASISKCFAAVLAAQLMEAGRLDFDKPIGEYLTEPEMKPFASMTIRQLLSHTAGVRHYLNPKGSSEMDDAEYYLTKYYATAAEAVRDLLCGDPRSIAFEPPGSNFLYSTHGYTLLSAVLEKVSDGQPIAKQFNKLFFQLGISSGTVLEQHAAVLGQRGRHYRRDKNGVLENAAYIDNSYKIAGGGVLSCAEDLVTFGETLLRCADGQDCNGVLKPDTLRMLWSPVPGTKVTWNRLYTSPYCLGFSAGSHRGEQIVAHTGASVGGTSVLLMAPRIGAVIAIICNLQSVSLMGLALSMLDAVLDYVDETNGAELPAELTSACCCRS